MKNATSKENPIIIALDVQNSSSAIRLVHDLAGSVGAFKVGLELITAVGPSIFDDIRNASGADTKIFLDAKFHDIPNTVAGALRSCLAHHVWMVNIHASGGSQMMRAAVDAANSSPNSKPLVMAVTVLTSTNSQVLNGELGVSATMEQQVVHLAKLAQDSGCDGVVASPHEVPAIRQACGEDFVIVTPGVRPAGADVGDQKRIMTPGEAIKQGSDYLVIGRPITQANNPRAAAESVLQEINANR